MHRIWFYNTHHFIQGPLQGPVIECFFWVMCVYKVCLQSASARRPRPPSSEQPKSTAWSAENIIRRRLAAVPIASWGPLRAHHMPHTARNPNSHAIHPVVVHISKEPSKHRVIALLTSQSALIRMLKRPVARHVYLCFVATTATPNPIAVPERCCTDVANFFAFFFVATDAQFFSASAKKKRKDATGNRIRGTT
jgi:hypothetical protein